MVNGFVKKLALGAGMAVPLLLFVMVGRVLWRVRTAQTVEIVATKGTTPRALELLSLGADPNAVLPDGESLLKWAARHDDIRLIKALLSKKAKVDAAAKSDLQAAWQRYLIRSATDGDAHGIIEALAGGASLGTRNSDGHTALEQAIIGKNTECVHELLKAHALLDVKTRSGLTMVQLALLDGNEPELVEQIVRGGAGMDAVSRYFVCAMRGDVDGLKRHLAEGVPVNATLAPGDHWTALFWGAASGQSEAVKLLLAKGADPGHTDMFSRTAAVATYDCRPGAGSGSYGGCVASGTMISNAAVELRVKRGRGQ